MAPNRLKVNDDEKSKGNLFDRIERAIRVDLSFENGISTKMLPRLLFVAALTLVYIGNTHMADRTIRQIDRLETEVEDLKADYLTLKADYMVATKQSEVAKRVKEMGLQENDEPPAKLPLKEE